MKRFHRNIDASPSSIYALLPFLPHNFGDTYRAESTPSSPIFGLPLVGDVHWDLYPQPLIGHSGGRQLVAFSPDGNHIISDANSHTIRIWERGGATAPRTLSGQSDWTRAVVISSDGKHIVSGSNDTTVRIWDFNSDISIRTLEGHTDTVLCVAVSKDGKWVSSSSIDKTVRLWDVSDRSCRQTFTIHSGWVHSLAFSPNGNQIVSGSDDQTIRVWSTSSGEAVRSLHGHTGSVMSVTFTHHGEHIVSGSYDNTIRVWDAKTGNCIRTLQEHTGPVTSVTTSTNDQYLISGSWDMTARVWDFKNGSLLNVLQMGFRVQSMAASPDGTQIVCGGDRGNREVWDFPSHHLKALSSVEFSPNGLAIRATFEDGMVRDFDVATPLAGRGTRVVEGDGVQTSIQVYSYEIDGYKEFFAGSDAGKLWEKVGGNKRLMCKVPLSLFWQGSELRSSGRHVVLWHKNGLLVHLDFSSAPV